jgi:alpha-tubulin suppressor-like RCC1 family protein
MWDLGWFGVQNPIPQRIGIDDDWLMVAGGSYVDPFGGPSLFGTHHLALKRDGSLWAWGNNLASLFGDDTTEYRLAPVPIGSDHDWVAITAGGFSSAALKGDGTLWRWGVVYEGGVSALPLQLGTDDDWVAVETDGVWNGFHTVGLKADGSLWAWGGNYFGQLGIGTTESTNIPVRVGTDNDWAVPPLLEGELRITALSIAADGRAHISFTHTNYRAYYILSRGAEPTNIQQPVQARLAEFPPVLVIDPAPDSSNASAFYRIGAVPVSQALDLDGDGIDDVYELRHARFLNPLNASDAMEDSDGDGRSNLREYRDGTDPSQDMGERHAVAASPNHIVVLKTDGSLWAWGDNSSGQLGDGTYENRGAPVRIGTDTNWISVVAGPGLIEGNTIGLKRDGSLWAWGGNSWGQLGTGGGNSPARIGLDNDWSAVEVGLYSTVALKRDGSLWTWGNVPTRIGSDSDWSAIAAGFSHTLALKTNGSLWAWGENQFGQCGFEQGVLGASEPTRVGTIRGWTWDGLLGPPSNRRAILPAH